MSNIEYLEYRRLDDDRFTAVANADNGQGVVIFGCIGSKKRNVQHFKSISQAMSAWFDFDAQTGGTWRQEVVKP